MIRYELHITLKSDAAFGRGDGIAGLVDEEVEHDAATGLPFIRGRTIKGLLVEECANVLYSLAAIQPEAINAWEKAAEFLFGRAGSALTDDAGMQIGTAMLPDDLCLAVKASLGESKESLHAYQILESLTNIRRQTAIDEQRGVPEEGSLRSIRVVLRQTSFVALLTFSRSPDSREIALLAACILGFRRGGSNRNRGLGRLEARLFCDGNDSTQEKLEHFCNLIEGEAR